MIQIFFFVCAGPMIAGFELDGGLLRGLLGVCSANEAGSTEKLNSGNHIWWHGWRSWSFATIEEGDIWMGDGLEVCVWGRTGMGE